MNRHLKCLLIFVALIGSMLLISLGMTFLMEWLSEVFGRQPVKIGMGIFSLGMIALLTHILCNVKP